MLISTSAIPAKGYFFSDGPRRFNGQIYSATFLLSSEKKSKSRLCTSRNVDEEVKFIFGKIKWRRLGIMSSICDYIVYMGWVEKVGYYVVHLWLYSIYGLSVEDSFTYIYIYIYIWVNCKLHPWSLELFGFYTPKFQKFDFTPWSLIPLTIHTL